MGKQVLLCVNIDDKNVNETNLGSKKMLVLSKQ